jgi:hypothetical protein
MRRESRHSLLAVRKPRGWTWRSFYLDRYSRGNHRPATEAMEVLTAQLKEQAAQIQQVRGQVQSNKPVPEFVSN